MKQISNYKTPLNETPRIVRDNLVREILIVSSAFGCDKGQRHGFSSIRFLKALGCGHFPFRVRGAVLLRNLKLDELAAVNKMKNSSVLGMRPCTTQAQTMQGMALGITTLGWPLHQKMLALDE